VTFNQLANSTTPVRNEAGNTFRQAAEKGQAGSPRRLLPRKNHASV